MELHPIFIPSDSDFDLTLMRKVKRRRQIANAFKLSLLTAILTSTLIYLPQ